MAISTQRAKCKIKTIYRRPYSEQLHLKRSPSIHVQARALLRASIRRLDRWCMAILTTWDSLNMLHRLAMGQISEASATKNRLKSSARSTWSNRGTHSHQGSSLSTPSRRKEWARLCKGSASKTNGYRERRSPTRLRRARFSLSRRSTTSRIWRKEASWALFHSHRMMTTCGH